MISERLSVCLAGLFLVGCASVEETHYFMTQDTATGEPVNFFRLSVSGGSELSSSRYVSGYYDETAVDLFFNEIRKSDTAGVGNTVFRDTTLFRQSAPETKPDAPKAGAISAEAPNAGVADTRTPPKSDTTELVSLSGDETGGAFMMILSTDADSIVNTIGSFAESTVVAESIATLLNSQSVQARRRSDAQMGVKVQQTNAALAIMEAHIATGKTAETSADGERAALYILSALARELGGDTSFGSIEDARTWFALEQSARGEDGS